MSDTTAVFLYQDIHCQERGILIGEAPQNKRFWTIHTVRAPSGQAAITAHRNFVFGEKNVYVSFQNPIQGTQSGANFLKIASKGSP